MMMNNKFEMQHNFNIGESLICLLWIILQDFNIFSARFLRPYLLRTL